MKIFITGATGFIGKEVLEQLKKSDHETRCLVRKTNPNIDALRSSGVEVIVGDVLDRSSLLEGMTGCDWVINLANVYSFWEPDKSVFQSTNVDGTRNVLECALESKVGKVVHISTVLIFGKPGEAPIKEDTVPGPERFSSYAKTKFEGDRIAWDLYHEKGLPLVVVYPGAVIGPGDPKASGAYVSGLVKKSLPATVFSDSVLTWVHVRDVAEAIIKAAEHPNNIGEKYIVAKHQISFKDFNKMISEISGVSLPIISMPDFLSMMNAYLLTGIANIIKKPPLWDMAVDQMKTMKEGFMADGSKAEKELGIEYTPIHKTLEEEIAAL